MSCSIFRNQIKQSVGHIDHTVDTTTSVGIELYLSALNWGSKGIKKCTLSITPIGSRDYGFLYGKNRIHFSPEALTFQRGRYFSFQNGGFFHQQCGPPLVGQALLQFERGKVAKGRNRNIKCNFLTSFPLYFYGNRAPINKLFFGKIVSSRDFPSELWGYPTQ